MAKKVERREVQEKLRNFWSYLQDNGLLIADREDMEIGGEPQPSSLVLGTAACCLNGIAVSFIGPPGTAKTSYMKLLGKFFSGEDIPIISGHPEQTEEKTIASPKVNKAFLEEGKRVPVWTEFVLARIKGIDEVNGLPPRMQGVFQRALAEGKYNYAGAEIPKPNDKIIVTMNPSGERTFPLDDAFKDRFAATVPFYTPTVNGLDAILERPDPRLGELSDYKKLIDGMGSLTSDEFEALPTFVRDTELDGDAKLFIKMLVQELSYCKRAEMQDKGQGRIAPTQICGGNGSEYKIRPTPQDGAADGSATSVKPGASSTPQDGLAGLSDVEEGGECEFGGDTEYVCKMYRQADSTRVALDLKAIAKAAAFVLGDEKADIEHVKAVAPYVLVGRLTPTQTKFNVSPYYGNKVFKYANDIVESVSKRFDDKKKIMTNYSREALEKRFGEKGVNYAKVMDELGNIKDPLAREYAMTFRQIEKHDIAEDAALLKKASAGA